MPITDRIGQPVTVNLLPMPDYMKELVDRERIYVFSVNPKSFDRPQGSSGMFTVFARKPAERVSRAVMYQGKPGIPRIIPETVVDSVEGRRVTQKWDFNTDGMNVARDICGLQHSEGAPENMTRYGVFIASGYVPTEAEIAAAELARDNEYRRLVKEADDLYRVNGGMSTENGKTSSNISSVHIEAATELGVERPWIQMTAPKAMAECPACGAIIKPGVAFCPNGDIVDEAKARIARPWLFRDEEPKRGPGRPRNEAA